jgi:tight adherence protein C
MIPLVLFILPCLFVVVLGPAILGMMDAFSSGGGLS